MLMKQVDDDCCRESLEARLQIRDVVFTLLRFRERADKDRYKSLGDATMIKVSRCREMMWRS